MKTKHKKTKLNKTIIKQKGGATGATIKETIDESFTKPFHKLSFDLENIQDKLEALATFMTEIHSGNTSLNAKHTESQITTARQFLIAHFKSKKESEDTTVEVTTVYAATYTNTSVFMLDPLLNDIDDIFAFIYFFYLSYANIIVNGKAINLHICVKDIEEFEPSKFAKIKSYVQSILDYCNNQGTGITVTSDVGTLSPEVTEKPPATLSPEVTEKLPATLFIHRAYTEKGMNDIFTQFKIKNIIMNGNVNIHNPDRTPIDLKDSKPESHKSKINYSCSDIPSNLRHGKNIEKENDINVRVTQFKNYTALWKNEGKMYVLPLSRSERLISLYFDKTKSKIRPREIDKPFVRKDEWGSNSTVNIKDETGKEIGKEITVQFIEDKYNLSLEYPPLNADSTQIPLYHKQFPHFPYHDYNGELTAREDYNRPSDFFPYLQRIFQNMQSSFDTIKAILNENSPKAAQAQAEQVSPEEKISIYSDQTDNTPVNINIKDVPFGELCFPNRKPMKTDIAPGKPGNPKYLLNDGTFTCEENGSFMIDALTVMATLGNSSPSILDINLIHNENTSLFMSKETDDPYKCEDLYTHEYSNIDYRGLDYCNESIVFLENCLKKYNGTDIPFENHLLKHFDTPENFVADSTFTSTYGRVVYFLIDPLFNDIDDVIAVLYFLCLAIECCPPGPLSQPYVTIYLDCDDINQVTPLKSAAVNANVLALIKLLNIIIQKSTKNISLLNMNGAELRKPGTPVPFERDPSKEPGTEYMLMAFNAHDMKLNKEQVKDINLSKLEIERPEPTQPKMSGVLVTDIDVTVFVLRGVADHANHLLEYINATYTKVNVIANGADIFSHEDGSCPSNIRFGTKIQEAEHSIRKQIFDSYIKFVKQSTQSTTADSKTNFYCFPLKRSERPFTLIFEESDTDIQAKTSISASTEVRTVSSENLNSTFISIRNELSKIESGVHNLAEICFPDKDNLSVGGCEAYKQYGSFLIDMITVMHAPREKPKLTRTLCLFTEKIDLSVFKNKVAIEQYSDRELTFTIQPNLMKKLYQHSKEALSCCYGVPIDGLDTQLNAIPKLERYTRYLSKTPCTLESSVMFAAYNPKPMKFNETTGINVNLINPECSILSNDTRVKINRAIEIDEKSPETRTPNDVPEVVYDDDFAIILDRNDTFIGGSVGPNGVLRNCNGPTYGLYRMNTIYQDEEQTRALMRDYIHFRDTKKVEVFKLYVYKLSKSGENNKTVEQFENIIKLLYNFYSWALTDRPTDVLEFLGMGIKSRCQTWARLKKDNDTPKLTAHNTIPVPHFQTVFYIKDEKKYDDALKAYFEKNNEENEITFDIFLENFNSKYIQLIYFLTRSMRDPYGNNYAIRVSNGYTAVAHSNTDPIFNGRAFVDLDSTYNLIKGAQEQSGKRHLPVSQPIVVRLENTPPPSIISESTIKIATYNVLESKLAGFETFTKQKIKEEHITHYNLFIKKYLKDDDYYKDIIFTLDKTTDKGINSIKDPVLKNESLLEFNKIREIKIIIQLFIILKQGYTVTLQEVNPFFSKKIIDILTAMGLNFKDDYDYLYCRGNTAFSKYIGPMLITPGKIDKKYYFYCHTNTIMSDTLTGYVDHGFDSNYQRFRNFYNPVLVCYMKGRCIITTHFPAEKKYTNYYFPY